MTLLEGFLLVIIGVLGFRLYMHRRYLHRMFNWISGPLDAPVPDASGIWGEFVSRMNRRVKTRQQEKDLLEQSLEQFQSALEALPDGVIFMDAHRRILWMNSLAVDMMGSSRARIEERLSSTWCASLNLPLTCNAGISPNL